MQCFKLCNVEEGLPILGGFCWIYGILIHEQVGAVDFFSLGC